MSEPRRVRFEVTVRWHDEGEDGLWAEVDELPGVFVSGSSRAEVVEALEEAIALYLSDDEHDVRQVRRLDPRPITPLRASTPEPTPSGAQVETFEKVLAYG